MTRRLPIVRVFERFAAVIMFAVLVYLLGVLISLLEVWQRPPAHWREAPRPMQANASGNPAAGAREYRVSIAVMQGAPCVLVIHGARDLGLIASRMVCNGRVCRETDLKINRRGHVVCTPERVSR